MCTFACLAIHLEEHRDDPMECFEEVIDFLPSVIQPKRSTCHSLVPVTVQEGLGAVMPRAYGYPHVIKECT